MIIDETKNEFAVIPLTQFVMFPEVTIPFSVNDDDSLKALRAGEARLGKILMLTENDSAIPFPLYRVGVVAQIESVIKGKSASQIVAQGLYRFRVESFEKRNGVLYAKGVRIADDQELEEGTEKALFNTAKNLADSILNLLPGNGGTLRKQLNAVSELSTLLNLTLANLDLPIEKKQFWLEITAPKDKALKALEHMKQFKDQLEVQHELAEKFNTKIRSGEREVVLREQLRAIKEALGEKEEGGKDSYAKKIAASGMPSEVRTVAEEEASRLETLGPQSPEGQVIRNYLDWLTAMPWKAETAKEIDLDEARKILDRDHHGMPKVKKRLLEHLALMKLARQNKGPDVAAPILLLVGPPGVGKTSLGESVAAALGRKFIRISLGGVSDEAEIRGHRRTYVGAMPGRLIQALKRAGSSAPVILLDEIDKLGMGFRGDPYSAMLEVLDPEQNKSFVDHYLDVPFDLSKVIFIATANTLDTIPAPLRDRTEIIELNGYTLNEKIEIAEHHLVPRLLAKLGIVEAKFVVPEKEMSYLISHYTREAGVRDLSRRLESLLRGSAELILQAEKYVITEGEIRKILGHPRFEDDERQHETVPGVVTGLAWTPFGGDILYIEASSSPGSGKLILTGQLGDVMKESAQIAQSLVKARMPGTKEENADQKDVHVHVPSGAVPKDGPSAGVTMTVALASLLMGKKVPTNLAMTGEITLRGAVLPVGGIKEKVLAAHRSGVTRVIMPLRNEHDLEEVPEEVRKQMTFKFARDITDVFNEVFPNG